MVLFSYYTIKMSWLYTSDKKKQEWIRPSDLADISCMNHIKWWRPMWLWGVDLSYKWPKSTNESSSEGITDRQLGEKKKHKRLCSGEKQAGVNNEGSRSCLEGTFADSKTWPWQMDENRSVTLMHINKYRYVQRRSVKKFPSSVSLHN